MNYGPRFGQSMVSSSYHGGIPTSVPRSAKPGSLKAQLRAQKSVQARAKNRKQPEFDTRQDELMIVVIKEVILTLELGLVALNATGKPSTLLDRKQIVTGITRLRMAIRETRK